MDKSQITPIEHATMVLNFGGKIIYTDPAMGLDSLASHPDADIILLTDIHQDHLNPDALAKFTKDKTVIVAPQAVADQLNDDLKAKTKIMKNGDTMDIAGIKIEAVPAYNIPEKAGSFHPKGRGNGYILEADNELVYIAGDTSATDEMRNLKNIDWAFLPMNLPYTMDVQEAADATLAFKPKKVTPYHYRGQGGLSDTKKFKDLVNQGDPEIEVDLINFYPNN